VKEKEKRNKNNKIVRKYREERILERECIRKKRE
jgi:hypothetical protein